MKSIISSLGNTDFDELMNSFKTKGLYSILIDGEEFDILKEDIIVEDIPLDDFSVSVNQNTVVGISTLITPELHNEGLIRDLIRYIQNLRKESDLSVDDRIDLVIKYDDNSFAEAIDCHKEYLLNEVLGLAVGEDLDSMDYTSSFKVNNTEVVIGIKVNN